VIADIVRSIDQNNRQARKLILVGGCSRAGKTTLVKHLRQSLSACGVNSVSIPLDSWIIDADKRKTMSTVMDRYEVTKAIPSIKSVILGHPIKVPEYDYVKRKRTKENGKTVKALDGGCVFVEGVIALGVPELVKIANLKIYVELDDAERKKRLFRYYHAVKGLDQRTAKNIIEERELEEIPFVKNSASHADIIFNNQYRSV